MAERRDNGASIIVMVLFSMFVFNCKMIDADTYTVGDERGWTFDIENWPSRKTFKEGDILVFNYNPVIHNVVRVNEYGYNSCVAVGGSRFYVSGADRITLDKGPNYFICGIPGHCPRGMKIEVNAN